MKNIYPMYVEVQHLRVADVDVDSLAEPSSQQHEEAIAFLEILKKHAKIAVSQDRTLSEVIAYLRRAQQCVYLKEFAGVKLARLISAVYNVSAGKLGSSLGEVCSLYSKKTEGQPAYDSDGEFKGKAEGDYDNVHALIANLDTIVAYGRLSLDQTYRLFKGGLSETDALHKAIRAIAVEVNPIDSVYAKANVLNAARLFIKLYYTQFMDQETTLRLECQNDKLLTNFVNGQWSKSFDMYIKTLAIENTVNEFMKLFSVDKKSYFRIFDGKTQLDVACINDVVDTCINLLTTNMQALIDWSLYKTNFLIDLKRYKLLYEIALHRQSAIADSFVQTCLFNDQAFKHEKVEWDDTEVRSFVNTFNIRYANIITFLQRFFNQFFTDSLFQWKPQCITRVYSKLGKLYLYNTLFFSPYVKNSAILKKRCKRLVSMEGSSKLQPVASESVTLTTEAFVNKKKVLTTSWTESRPVSSYGNESDRAVKADLSQDEMELWMTGFQTIEISLDESNSLVDTTKYTYDVNTCTDVLVIHPSYQIKTNADLGCLHVVASAGDPYAERVPLDEVKTDYIKLALAANVRDIKGDLNAILAAKIEYLIQPKIEQAFYYTYIPTIKAVESDIIDADFYFSLLGNFTNSLYRTVNRLSYGEEGQPIKSMMFKMDSKQTIDFPVSLRAVSTNIRSKISALDDGEEYVDDNARFIKKPYASYMPDSITVRLTLDLASGMKHNNPYIRYDNASSIYIEPQVRLASVDREAFDKGIEYQLHPGTGDVVDYVDYAIDAANVYDAIARMLNSLYTSFKFNNFNKSSLNLIKNVINGIIAFVPALNSNGLVADSMYAQTSLTWGDLSKQLKNVLSVDSQKKRDDSQTKKDEFIAINDAYVQFYEKNFSLASRAISSSLTDSLCLTASTQDYLNDMYHGLVRPLSIMVPTLEFTPLYRKYDFYDTALIDSYLTVQINNRIKHCALLQLITSKKGK